MKLKTSTQLRGKKDKNFSKLQTIKSNGKLDCMMWVFWEVSRRTIRKKYFPVASKTNKFFRRQTKNQLAQSALINLMIQLKRKNSNIALGLSWLNWFLFLWNHPNMQVYALWLNHMFHKYCMKRDQRQQRSVIITRLSLNCKKYPLFTAGKYSE